MDFVFIRLPDILALREETKMRHLSEELEKRGLRFTRVVEHKTFFDGLSSGQSRTLKNFTPNTMVEVTFLLGRDKKERRFFLIKDTQGLKKKNNQRTSVRTPKKRPTIKPATRY